MITFSILVFIIGPESDHWQCLSVTHSLTNSVTFRKLVEVVTVADVRDEDRVRNSLLQIWKLRFGHKAFVQTLSTLVKILKLNLGQYSEARFGLDFNSSFS